MTFFQNNQPPEQEAGNPSTAVSHSAKSQPLFKQDPDLSDALPGQHMTLSAYISKHLQTSEQPAAPVETGSSPARFQFITSAAVQQQQRDRESTHLPQGQYLNSLDVDLAAGLEQYLPTPLFRMRVMKKRLDGEIAELKMRLNKYDRLPNQSVELQGHIAAMRSRLETLEAHERQVSQDLAASLTMGSWFYDMSQQSQRASNLLETGFGWLRQMLTHLLYGHRFLQVENASLELRGLQELLADRIQDKNASSMEISQILNRYEQTAHQTTALTQQLKPQSLWVRLWQEARRLIK